MLAGRSHRNCPVFDIQRSSHKHPRQKWKNRYFYDHTKCCCFVLFCCCSCLFVCFSAKWQSQREKVNYEQVFFQFVERGAKERAGGKGSREDENQAVMSFLLSRALWHHSRCIQKKEGLLIVQKKKGSVSFLCENPVYTTTSLITTFFFFLS